MEFLPAPLLKQHETTIDAEFQNRHRCRDDPENNKRQPGQSQVVGPIRFMMMNQSHAFLPRGL